jgi:hypothetical protein
MRKLKYVKLFENFLSRMGIDFPTVDFSDENKARVTWIDGYFYKIKDFLMKNLNVIDPNAKYNQNYNQNFVLRMSVSGFQPNLGYKSFELQIENRNDNSLFKAEISKQGNKVKILGSGTTGEMKVLFFSDKYSIECFLEVCQTVAKNFLNFEIDIVQLKKDLFEALGEGSEKHYYR